MKGKRHTATRLALPLALLLALSPAVARADAAGSSAEEAHQRNLRAMGLSLLLPGLAQYADGQHGRAAAFFAAEAGIWTSFAAFRVQGGLRKDSYVEMAHLYAGVERPAGRADEYYRLLGNWPSSELYDEYVTARDARSLYPDDLAARAAYIASHGIPADQAWSWQTSAAWGRYRKKRSDSEAAYSHARNMLALAAANRVVALLDATLISGPKGHPRTLHLEMAPGLSAGSTALRLRCAFP